MPNRLSTPSYRHTLDSLIEGFQIIGHDFTYLYVNPAAAAQGRSTPEALEGRKMWEAYPGFEQTPFFAELTQCMADQTTRTVENLFTYADGSQRWFELRIEPVPSGAVIHSVDIHDRKIAQAELERLNAELERRVVERTKELEELNAELDAFAYSVSHDLRAPIRHVTGFAEILSDDAAHRLTAEDRECISRIVNAARRMDAMILALLGFSRLGRAPLDRQPVDLVALIDAARRDLEPDISGRPITWSVGELPRVVGDPALLQLALGNLLSNAIKYTRGCNPATITITGGVHRGEATVSIRDNGVGFDAGASAKLFGVFQRLHTESEFEGTGIGLANVRRIIARHGGRVWAEGQRGEGATFSFTLPVATDDTAVPVRPDRDRVAARSR